MVKEDNFVASGEEAENPDYVGLKVLEHDNSENAHEKLIGKVISRINEKFSGIPSIVVEYVQKNIEMLKGKDGKDGKDGYTPQKNIDYFDGEQGPQGEQGLPGVAGKDGAPGYTPQKGIDYFTPEDIASLGLSGNLKVWQPNTEYKAGDFVLALRFMWGDNVYVYQFARCIAYHISPDVGTLYDDENYLEFWEEVLTPVAYAMYDEGGNRIAHTYTTKEELNVEVGKSIKEWRPDTEYYEGDFVLGFYRIGDYEAHTYKLYRCLVDHLSPIDAETLEDDWRYLDFWMEIPFPASSAMHDENGNRIINTYVTNEQFNETVGDVSTALDEILEIQNSLTGGELALLEVEAIVDNLLGGDEV